MNLNLLDKCGLKDVSNLNAVDRTSYKTKIEFRNKETGEVIWRGHNKVILPGAGFIARSLFSLTDSEITPSYNSALQLDESVYSSVPMNDNKIFLFCVGTDGCGTENSQVYEEDYRKWIMPDAMVPFQYRPRAKDLNDADRETYFGKKTLTEYLAYYFKTFDSEPALTQQFIDGTPIDSTIYTNTTTTPVETFVTLYMSINTEDCRDYFIATTGLNDARINTISLCTCWYKEINGFKYYQDIRPVTKLNFPNEPLIDLRKGIDIKYEIYF